MMNAQAHALADWVERTALPLLLAFVFGLLAGEWSSAEQAGEARDAVRQARAAVARAEVALAHWRHACEPLLSLPPQSTPELIPGPLAQAGEAAAHNAAAATVLRPGVVLRALPLATSGTAPGGAQ